MYHLVIFVVALTDQGIRFRAWAELELKRAGHTTVPQRGYVASVTSWAKKWFQRDADEDETDAMTDAQIEITEDMRREFLETIEYQPPSDKELKLRDEIPLDWVHTRVEFSLPRLSLLLTQQKGPVCSVALNAFTVRMTRRARGLQLLAELGNVEAVDLLHQDHPLLIEMVQSAPLVSCHLRSDHALYDLMLLVTPIQVNINKDIIHAIAAIFTRHHTPSIQHIEIAAKYQLRRIGRRTRRHVERRMKQADAITLRCDVDVALPRIVVANRSASGIDCHLTIDLGHLRVQHNDQPLTPQNNEFNVMWDQLHVTALISQPNTVPQSHTLLHPLTLTVDVMMATVPTAAQARIK